MKKRGQVTIFIIVAILVVLAIVLVFFSVSPSISLFGNENLNLEDCVQNSLEDTLQTFSDSSTFIQNEFSIAYQGQSIPYLCYTNTYYETCIVQIPFLKQHVEKNLKTEMQPKIQNCYDNSLNELKSRGVDVTSGEVDSTFSIQPGQILVNINAPTSVGQNNFKTFNARASSNIYEMLMVSTSILQYETKLGDSDTTSLMTLYPNLIIDKLKQSEGTTIYILTDKLDKTTIKFASRSLAWPAGFDQ